jgi:molybdate transport system substrate-binding protein
MKRYSVKARLVLLILLFSSQLMAADVPIFAAASSIKFALQEIAEAFYQETDKRVRISYSSSGNLTRQIRQGAPYELFLSANADYTELLYQQQKTLDKGVIFALGRLAFLTDNNSSLPFDEELVAIKKLAEAGQLHRFAIANPMHAPYGVAAREVLQQLGLWETIKPHLAVGENVAQATQFVSLGAAQAGLVSYSLALAPALQNRTRSLLIPANLHQPLQQTMVLLNSAGETSKLFFIYLQQDKARAILSRYGYSVPQE